MPIDAPVNLDSEETIPLLDHYVYCLIDPRNRLPFYIGKGQGSRAGHHAKEAAHKDANGKTIEGRKLLKIKEIHDADLKVEELVVARFETEDEAFAVEATLIHWVHGKENLTNEQSGHGVRFIRPFGNFETIQGIDIPTPLRSFNGEFKDKKMTGLLESGAYLLLEKLKESLSYHQLNWRDFSAPADRRLNPGESNGVIGVLVQIQGVDFRVCFGKSQELTLAIMNTDSTRSPKAQQFLKKIENNLGPNFSLTELRNGSLYSYFVQNTKYPLDELMALFNKFSAL